MCTCGHRCRVLEDRAVNRSGVHEDVEHRVMMKASSAEATCRRLASDAMTRAKTICDTVLHAVAALEAKVEEKAGQEKTVSAITDVMNHVKVLLPFPKRA